MTVTISLPLPHKHLSPNSRCHWRAKAKAVKAYRAQAGLEVMAETCGERWLWKEATVECRFYFKDIRRRDADNLLASMKSAFDGLADAGLVENDAAFTYLPVQQAKDKTNPRVEIAIERKDGAK